MSNHFSADNLKFPGDDRRLDLTDVFVFQAPGGEHHHGLLYRHQPGKTVLIMDSNPTSAPPPIPAPTTGPEFHPDAVYRINIDTDGDLHADVAFTFTFSEYENGTQTGSAWYATGAQARQPEPAGEQLTDSLPVSFDGTAQPVQAGRIRLSAGLRSDPFFADVEGALHGLQWIGHDDFAENNVDSIQPADDVANYLGPWSKILENGGYPPDEARTAALTVLPDILRYDRTKPATYPNGRILTDDVYSMRFAWLTHGKVGPTGLKPHDDLLNEFPYLGLPNP